MKNNFIVKPANSPFGDTAFYITNLYKNSGFLFDCGNIRNLKNSHVRNIEHIFISHTHMDHFSGFDKIIRAFISEKKRLYIYGPKNIIKNVHSKLMAYSWNLVKEYEFEIVVIELSNNKQSHKAALLKAKDEFAPNDIEIDDIYHINDGFRFDYTILDHGIPSIAYKVSSPKIFNFNSEKILEDQLLAGGWLKELKNSISENSLNKTITVSTQAGKKQFLVSELLKYVKFQPDSSITFITDIAPTDENIEKAASLAQNSSILLVEGVFNDESIDQAKQKNHLYFSKTREIFRKSNSEKIHIFHYSPRYEKIKIDTYKKAYLDLSKNKLF